MAKYINYDGMDQELAWVAGANRIHVLSGSPTNWTEFYTTFNLAGSPLLSGSATADFAVANGDVSGRKLTVSAKAGLSISASGSATYVALGDDSGSTIMAFTTCTTQYLTSGGTVDIPTWKIEIADPT